MSYWANIATESQIDYNTLRDFLLVKEYYEADKETKKILLKMANCTNKGYLEKEDCIKLSCIDLRILDQLWVNYSLGKYGFSVQKKIFEQETISRFIEFLGWYGNNTYTISLGKKFDSVTCETWFDKDTSYLQPIVYPYKALINLEEVTKYVEGGNPVKNWGDVGKQLLNLSADFLSKKTNYSNEYYSFKAKVNVLKPRGDYRSFLKEFYKRLFNCGIC
ncbi:MAG: GUN4 domain-containing protein [Crocosphaera sp.]|nr:GUN4 domain-containing protein [Crocosphaera sp.]